MRCLSRERGLTFSAVVNRWIAWSGDTDSDGALARLPEFVAHVCDTHGIPCDFYVSFAGLEVSPRPAVVSRRNDPVRHAHHLGHLANGMDAYDVRALEH